jgi:hypothetical protein
MTLFKIFSRAPRASFITCGLLAASLVGCAKNNATAESKPAANPPATPAVTTPVTTPAPVAPAVKFEKLKFDKNAVPKSMAHEGEIRDGAKWLDRNGENTLFVTTSVAARGGSEIKIFGYLYAVKDGQTKLLWKITDGAVNDCDEGEGLVSPIDVRDIDDDGVAENLFVYNVVGTCDVSPKPYKLMMHSGEKKYAIRGVNRVLINDPAFSDAERKGKKDFDPAFNGAPQSYKQAASAFWDKYVKPLGGNQ